METGRIWILFLDLFVNFDHANHSNGNRNSCKKGANEEFRK